MSALGRRTRAAAAALLAGVALAVAGCSRGSSSPDDPDPDFGANDPNLVVALGNSITFGLGDSAVPICDESLRGAGGYEPRLQRLTGKTVVNEGVCGERSADTAARVRGVLRRWRPGVLLIEVGINDMQQGSSEVMRNLRTIVEATRGSRTVPVLGTLPPTTGPHRGWSAFVKNVNANIRAYCEENGIEFADLNAAFLNDPDFQHSPFALLTEDGLHPNRAGYELMAKTWRWPLLRVY